MTSALSRQLSLLGHDSRVICIENAKMCPSSSRSDVARYYAGYTAMIAHQNLQRMRQGPGLLSLATRKQFTRLVTILLTERHLPKGSVSTTCTSKVSLGMDVDHA